jgi:hypothetical protein
VSNEIREKKPRAKRRNWEKIVSDLKTYCELKHDVLVSVQAEFTGEKSLHIDGRLAAYEDILRRIG